MLLLHNKNADYYINYFQFVYTTNNLLKQILL